MAAPKKPTKKPTKKPRRTNPEKPKTTGKARIDWDAAELAYTRSLTITTDEIAERFGAAACTVRDYAAKNEWTRKRREYRGKAIEQGLELALEMRREGEAAIIATEYGEGHTILHQLQALRMRDSKDWKPQRWVEYIRAFKGAAEITRLAMGMPTEIRGDPTQGREGYEEAIRRSRKSREESEPEQI